MSFLTSLITLKKLRELRAKMKSKEPLVGFLRVRLQWQNLLTRDKLNRNQKVRERL